MRILLVHPNYHSGGAEIAGNWPPAWAAYLAGALKGAGFEDVQFLDAMTNNLDAATIRAEMARIAPDVVGVTSITPSIYAAEEVLKIAQEVVPDALRMLGGIHATFMYRQVLTEAPWIDVIVRGEGEEILVALMQAVQQGRFAGTHLKRNAGAGFKDTAASGSIGLGHINIAPRFGLMRGQGFAQGFLQDQVAALPNHQGRSIRYIQRQAQDPCMGFFDHAVTVCADGQQSIKMRRIAVEPERIGRGTFFRRRLWVVRMNGGKLRAVQGFRRKAQIGPWQINPADPARGVIGQQV